MGAKSVGSASFGVVCGGVCCLTIFVFGTATVRVTVLVSGLAIFFATATTLLLVLNSNVCLILFNISDLNTPNSMRVTNV